MFALLAGANWWAVDRRSHDLVALTKTAATLLLVAIAATVGSMDGVARGTLVLAVVACLIGDVALLGQSERRFVLGLAAFAGAHWMYAGTALVVGVSWGRAPLAVPFLVVLFGFRFVTATVPAARTRGGDGLMFAVALYAVVISFMVLTAFGTGTWAAATGAMLFAVSDWMIGYDRFVKAFPHARLAVMMTYHLGLLLLISGLIAAG